MNGLRAAAATTVPVKEHVNIEQQSEELSRAPSMKMGGGGEKEREDLDTFISRSIRIRKGNQHLINWRE